MEIEVKNNIGVLKTEAMETGISKMGVSISGQGGLNDAGAEAIDGQEDKTEENSDLDFPDSGDEEEDEETALLREEVRVAFSLDGQLCSVDSRSVCGKS